MTVVSPSGHDYHEVINVTDEFVLPPIHDTDEWLEIETLDGGTYAVPTRLVVAVVVEAAPPAPPKRKRAR